MDTEAVTAHGLDRESLRRLSRRSNTRGVLQLSAHLTLLCATGVLLWAARGSFLIVPAMVLEGIVLNFLFCPLHETTHWSAFASRRANAAVGWICGALLLLPPQYFRQRLPALPTTVLHPGSRARSGTGATGAGHDRPLPMASIGPAQLAQADHRHASPCADGPGKRILRARPHARRDCARSPHRLDRLSAGTRRIARPAAAGGADLLGSPRTRRTTLPAAVPHGRAHRLRLERQSVWQHPHHVHHRRAPPAGLAHALPCRAPLLPVDPLLRTQAGQWRSYAIASEVAAPGYLAVHRELLRRFARRQATRT